MDLSASINRIRFDSLASTVFRRIGDNIKAALEKARLDIAQLDEVRSDALFLKYLADLASSPDSLGRSFHSPSRHCQPSCHPRRPDGAGDCQVRPVSGYCCGLCVAGVSSVSVARGLAHWQGTR